MKQVVDLKAVNFNCTACGLYNICINSNDSGELEKQAEGIVKKERILRKGEFLYEFRQPFKNLYAVSSGSLKAFRINKSGEERIVGFYMPGDLLGFDAIWSNTHSFSAVALENSHVCEISYKYLEETYTDKGMGKYFMEIMSSEIVDKHKMIMMMNGKPAEARIASFLISLSSRCNTKNKSPLEFSLSMTRDEVGNYLGLATETVCRQLSHLQKEKIITINYRKIIIHDKERLFELIDESVPVRNKPGITK